MIAKGNNSICLNDIMSKVSESYIVSFYLGVTHIPCVIKSPLRKDNKPSFGLYSLDGKRIYYKDLSTGDRGGLFDLLGLMWGKTYLEVLEKIYKDLPDFNNKASYKHLDCKVENHSNYDNNTELKCKVREWKDYDIEYWESYGISLKWLKYAEVYPISHKIVIKNNNTYLFKADKYAYAYIEHKDERTTIKIYQPYNTLGYKWQNKHDGSVISLWTKIPKTGDKLCICSSLKDALCLSCNTKIPAIALQGEGYNMSDKAVSELKKRFKKIYVLFDNDEAGRIDGEKLANQTGFINIVLPEFKEGKDISDLYRSLQDKQQFNQIILNLFN